MSSEPAIRVVGLSKSFHVGMKKSKDQMLAGRIARGVTGMFRRRSRRKPAVHWALDDISLEIARGDIVALIGHNGAGKSTLLKILARITDPTAGYAELRGRVGSLLEVGTGFHPELTGRENVFLSGAILGMSRAEIARDFDEIVAFAEVEKFIDTPIKHYSSGMSVRLAFSVATQLRPEILLIDEVLAVGDAQFQRKCLQRIQDVGRGDRTIIFVSHNMGAVRAICRTGFVLDGGKLVAQGDISNVVDAYLSRAKANEAAYDPVETETFRLDEVSVRAADGLVIKTFESMEIEVKMTARVDVVEPGVIVKLLSINHDRIGGLDYWNYGAIGRMAAGEQRTVGFKIDKLPLLPGAYYVEVAFKNSRKKIEPVNTLFAFEVVETPLFGTRPAIARYGSVALDASVTGNRTD